MGGLNLYSYILNNSLNTIDLLGAEPVTVAVITYYTINTLFAMAVTYYAVKALNDTQTIVLEATSKRDRKYPPKAIDIETTPPPCPDDPCKGLETCDQLRARGFVYTTSDMAINAAIEELGSLISHTILPKHKIKNPDLVYHENLRWKDDPSGKKYGQPSSIIGSLCCENGEPPPKVLYMYTRNKF